MKKIIPFLSIICAIALLPSCKKEEMVTKKITNFVNNEALPDSTVLVPAVGHPKNEFEYHWGTYTPDADSVLYHRIHESRVISIDENQVILLHPNHTEKGSMVMDTVRLKYSSLAKRFNELSPTHNVWVILRKHFRNGTGTWECSGLYYEEE